MSDDELKWVPAPGYRWGKTYRAHCIDQYGVDLEQDITVVEKIPIRGNLILYKSSGTWYERIITFATKGPWVHVAIVIDADTVIAARSNGIRYEAMPPDNDMHATIPLDGRATPEGIEQGLEWAAKQLGDGYSWADIVYQGVKLVWPGNPLRFYIAGRFDCSEYATRYLLQAGVVLPPAFDDPETVTPNDLARWAGVLKGVTS